MSLKTINNVLTLKNVFMIVLLCMIFAFSATIMFSQIYSNYDSSSNKIIIYFSFVIGQLFMLVPLAYVISTNKIPIIESIRFKKVPHKVIYYSILLGLGIIIILDEIDIILQNFIQTPKYITSIDGFMNPDTTLGFLLIILAVVIIAPIGEEILFRGFLQQYLEIYYKDITRAVITTSIIFTIIHFNPFWMLQIYLMGAALGFLSWRTGSIIPSIFVHMLNNGLAIFSRFNQEEYQGFYSFYGHVSPLLIIISFILIFISFKAINSYNKMP